MVPLAATGSWSAARHCLERDLEQGMALWDTLMGAEQGLQSLRSCPSPGRKVHL